MGTDFNGGQINTSVTEVESLSLLLISLLYASVLVITSTSSWPWCEWQPIKPTVKLKCCTQLCYEQEWKNRRHLSYISSSPCQLHYYSPNYRFLTPCYHFLVKALTPPPSLHPSDWSASRCFWVASLSRQQQIAVILLATTVNFFLSLLFALYCYATAANFLWRGDSCQEKCVFKRTAN